MRGMCALSLNIVEKIFEKDSLNIKYKFALFCYRSLILGLDCVKVA
jgi:hypothetical protein